ncbi:oxygenase MpaB family protein [Hoyosella subflava]|uniref:ER-bound oxygenase mpaB/mpaB'/Rubber oxygenase catalytic domain-containing protein n=1 Tax=Hoyosella subflava (strain DSM 45089 / JCM 17490 / NBRC 109087 / DQS3-9A1) TaxID=443218 RepID=F6EJ15_HOYSD|nr:oxygenase MpaB family protein [Hoyosella subflava]AEF41247.1 hypothetical protein AS9A_2800 [Hoyosella subflava DQS3-9A1]
MSAEPSEYRFIVGDAQLSVDHGAPRAEDDVTAEELRLLNSRFDGVSAALAGAANVVMQLSWPEIGYGVMDSPVDSGNLFKRPVKRARTTLAYISIALFGTVEERKAYGAAVNTSHRQVRSGPQSPIKYNAFNRELQLWVASCLYYGVRDTFIRMHGPLSEREELVLLRACGRLGTTLQMHRDQWFTTLDEFNEYWESGLQRVHIDQRTARYFDDVLRANFLPRPLSFVIGPFLYWANVGFLPPLFREQLGVTWSQRDQARHDRMMRILGVSTRRLPVVVRQFPNNAMHASTSALRKLGRPLV